MKKIIVTFCVLMLLCGCGKKEKPKPATATASSIVVTMPQDDTVNGYRQNKSAKAIDGETYYANIDSMKFHKKECTYAKRLMPEKRWITNDREALLKEGYQPCGFCDP